MKLKIEIDNVSSSEANSICTVCSDAVERLNELKKIDNDIFLATMSFSCQTDEPPAPVVRESTTFSRYMQKAADTHKGPEDV